ncbi:metal transporter [Streptomyces agglomeratus]|uniref:pentapeptide repeat-containing protein n=1 Tax=Streptomyces agglomeratus TaxID=285458 RepID=UPI000854FE2E|nr:pentapeptide repeat-containing protein [Streptomyces agglomeratus]OEJ43160.1 metal transporter [Streptomyces agglomeratus]
MTSTSPHAAPDAPPWPHCRYGATADNVDVGCRGRLVEPHTACLAHLGDADRSGYLAGLHPGADLDHRGTPISEELLSGLLRAVMEPESARVRLGHALFGLAKFYGNADFGGVEIEGNADFTKVEIGGDVDFTRAVIGGNAVFVEADIRGDAQFSSADIRGYAQFDGARIGGHAQFARAAIGGYAWFARAEIGKDAQFPRARIGSDTWFASASIGGHVQFGGSILGGDAAFRGATIAGDAQFVGAAFEGDATFRTATIGGHADFGGVTFGGDARFGGATIAGDTTFRRVVFEHIATVGPLVCTGALDLTEAVFATAVTIEAAAGTVGCRRTRWASTAALRLRHATVDLSDAVLEYPVSISAQAKRFTEDGREIPELGLTDPRVRAASLRGVDAAHLVLTDVDLTDCLFAGTVHLDQLRLDGLYVFATTPTGFRRRGVVPVRWTPRRTLAEEHHWRATRPARAGGWNPAPGGEVPLEPAALAPVYRQLRKAFEDGKHEPGAADFYYGEMEMRRHAHDIPRSERALLTAYWALSGYGLRASRALGWLLGSMAATVLVMLLWGLPKDDPKPGKPIALTGRSVTLTINRPEPVNPDQPYRERLSTKRFEKSLRVVINSVVFRASGQDLTTAGTYTEMTSRLVEPALLGFAVLAVRGRVKR